VAVTCWRTHTISALQEIYTKFTTMQFFISLFYMCSSYNYVVNGKLFLEIMENYIYKVAICDEFN
jgi:hypothetical protein